MKKIIVRLNNIRNGNTVTCGCFRKEVTHETLIVDLTGQRFSKLTIVENTGTAKDGNFMWLCKCDCGETTTVKSGHLFV